MSDPTEPPTPVKTPSPPAASPRKRSSTVDGRSLDELTLQGYVVVDDPTSLQAHRVQVFAAFALSRLADGVKSGEDECEAGKAVVLYGEALRGLKRVATALVPHKNEAKAAELLALVEDARQSIVERAASCRDLCGNQPVRRVLGDGAAVLARSSGGERAPPRHRAGVASMAWRTTR